MVSLFTDKLQTKDSNAYIQKVLEKKSSKNNIFHISDKYKRNIRKENIIKIKIIRNHKNMNMKFLNKLVS